jgi:hypothetical protein
VDSLICNIVFLKWHHTFVSVYDLLVLSALSETPARSYTYHPLKVKNVEGINTIQTIAHYTLELRTFLILGERAAQGRKDRDGYFESNTSPKV